MRALYIGKFFRSWATERYVEYALKQHGVEVIRRHYTSALTFESLKRKVLDCQPDFVLFSKASHVCYLEFLPWCRENNVLTVCWLWDLYWGYRLTRPIQFKCELLFTTDGGHDKSWLEYGANHRVLRQGIHSPEHVMMGGPPTDQLAFIGSPSSYRARRQLTEWLKFRFGPRVTWYNGTRGLDLNAALGKTKIVIGDSFHVKGYWSNRIYEVLGRGGFLLHPRTEGLDEEFTDGVHYIAYERNNFKDLKAKIDYYLANEEERELIRRAGFEHCGKYTYETRVAELLKQIEAYRQTRITNVPATTVGPPQSDPVDDRPALGGQADSPASVPGDPTNQSV